jgi:hypothetical protein
VACGLRVLDVSVHISQRRIHFHNGYQSEGPAHIPESVMQHQTAFSLPADLGRQGLLQIPTPTQEESVVAAASVSEALDRVGSAPAQLAQKKSSIVNVELRI